MLSFIYTVYIKIMTEIVLVPTSHVARESLKSVKKAIEKEKPDCVAVELDINRYYAMKEEAKAKGSTLDAMRNLGFLTFILYWVLKSLQSWIGKKMGILPGSEMVEAVDVARKAGIKVALIDRDIRITVTRMNQIPWTEKANLLLFLFKGMIIDYPLMKLGRGGQKIDLNKVPPKEIINEAMNTMKKEFPHLYRILVTERDKFMSARLKDMSKKFKKIVVVIGAGHMDGITKMLK